MIFASLALAAALQGPKIDYTSAWTSIRHSIETRYYARKEQHGRMESLLDKYQSAAEAAKNQGEFEKDVNDMIDEFGDSHFGFFTKSDQEFYLMKSLTGALTDMPSIGAWFRREGNGYAIQMLLDGGGAQAAGMRKGDVVTQVDGQAFTPVDSLLGKEGKKVKIDFIRAGSPMSADVDVVETSAKDLFVDATRASIRTIDYEGKKYGYVHLWTMSDDQEKSLLANAALGRLANTDGFILDIRDGFGGRPEGFGDPFFRPAIHLEWESQGFTTQELFGYQKPMVLIINRGSRSAKEVFAFIMRKSKRATLVGETTAGNVLGTFPSPVGDWAYLEMPLVDVKADGVRLEKVGVPPDDPVAKEFDAKGDDLYLQEALKVLSRGH